MKERPILFSGDMVRAILEGRKTQTRRVVKSDRYTLPEDANKFFVNENGIFQRYDGGGSFFIPLANSYGVPGDILWVRESWAAGKCSDNLKPSDLCQRFYSIDMGGIWYNADNSEPLHPFSEKGKNRPSIFMPRWASRIFLEITNIRVERLQDISERDAIAEGCDNSKTEAALQVGWHEKPQRAFRRLWEQINGTDSWSLNPWVWVVEFKRIDTH